MRADAAARVAGGALQLRLAPGSRRPYGRHRHVHMSASPPYTCRRSGKCQLVKIAVTSRSPLRRRRRPYGRGHSRDRNTHYLRMDLAVNATGRPSSGLPQNRPDRHTGARPVWGRTGPSAAHRPPSQEAMAVRQMAPGFPRAFPDCNFHPVSKRASLSKRTYHHRGRRYPPRFPYHATMYVKRSGYLSMSPGSCHQYK